MLVVIFGVIALICAAGWFVQYLGAATLIWFLQEKGYPLPSDEEMKRGSRWVVAHLLNDLFGNVRKH